MNELSIGLIIAAFTVVLASTLAYVVRLNNKQAQMTVELAKLQVKVSPMWATVQARMSSDLHHPHSRYQEMDSLLEKLEALTITPEERNVLKELLLVRSTDMHKGITESQRRSALAMIPLMDLVVIEATQAKDITRGILPTKGGDPT